MDGLCALRLQAGKSSLFSARCIEIIDCLQLPHNIVWHQIGTIDAAYDAIKSMKIRGAPAIASLAAVSIACELYDAIDTKSDILSSSQSLFGWLTDRSEFLLSSRPTAVNLREAMHRLRDIASRGRGNEVCDTARAVAEAAELVWTEDVERNVRIGDNGAAWLVTRLEQSGAIAIGEKINVLTVCNTGSLATSGYGTALGVITSLYRMQRLAHAFYAQTGPYQQGARLTSLELQSQQIPSTMVCDTMMASLLSGNCRGQTIHAFVLGADRIAANGDTANKISSFQIATLVRHVPPPRTSQRALTLVCAPVATFDLSMDNGTSIIVEERPNWEACTVRGKVYNHSPSSAAAMSEAMEKSAQQAKSVNAIAKDHRADDVVTVLVTPEGTIAWNPAFDITPAHLIDGVASELGVAEAVAAGGFDLRAHAHRAADYFVGSIELGQPSLVNEWAQADKAGGANGVLAR